MRSFRLAVINPNTNASHTDSIQSELMRALPAGTKVSGLTASEGPEAIESAFDSVHAAAAVVRLVAGHPDHDAYLVACFDDPGVDAARELTTAPVVGIGAAAYHGVSLVAKRFAVITTLRRGQADLEDGLRHAGAAHRCVGVMALEIPVAEQGAAFPSTTHSIIALARRAIRESGAEAIVLACGGTSGVVEEVAQAAGVPVTNGVAVGGLLAYSLWAAGLRTSKTGTFASPEPIRYRTPATRS